MATMQGKTPASRLHQAMHVIEKRRDLLNLVKNNPVVFGAIASKGLQAMRVA